MRKLTIIIAILCCMSAQAQKITVDKTETDGARIIGTSIKNCRDFTDRVVFGFGLSYISVSGKNEWQLNIDITTNDVLRIEAGETILIRTASGNVLELKSDLNSVSHLEDMSTAALAMSAYVIHIMATVTPEQLDDICGGVVKIRACGNDKEYKKDKAGKYLAQCRKLITERASKPNDF